jgi:peptide deformylase
MIQPILLYGNSMLKQVSGIIPEKFPKLKELINDMFETMHKADGIGLSGIQIGIPLQIFVVEAHLEQENFHFRDAFINPYIEEEWGSLVKHPEGCLSIPNLNALVERRENIKLNYYDSDWNHHVKNFDGFKARMIQHECDHLKGILYIEHLDRMWLKVLEKPLQLIKEREIQISYLYK